jgi:hypothetical protein
MKTGKNINASGGKQVHVLKSYDNTEVEATLASLNM